MLARLSWLGLLRRLSGLPRPSWELSLDVRAKARVARLLKRRKSREAGFTEQRSPPSPVGGGITGRFSTGPTTYVSSVAHNLTSTFFFSFTIT